MYKSKLQELCQKNAWSLPEYSTVKEGVNHNPSFQASVTVNGTVFLIHHFCKSSKQAQNDAAKLALDHFSALTPVAASAISHSSSPLSHGSVIAARGTLQEKTQETDQTPQVHGTSSGFIDNSFEERQHLYKNQLQIYAQKRNLVLPMYCCEREGPPHASRFRCKVTIDGQTYESLEFFSTLKEAEHAAAKVALKSFLQDAAQEEDYGFYKNLLQELAQKEGYRLPVYNTKKSGEAHIPTFVSRVEIEGHSFTGQEAKTKKQAEIYAAKVAYTTLRGRKPNLSNHHIPVQSAVPVRNKDAASSEIVSVAAQEPISSDPTLPKVVLDSSPSPSHCTTNMVVDSIPKPAAGTSTLSCNKVIVCPRSSNMTFPEGSTMLPMSNDIWVAVEHRLQLNQ